MTNEEQEESKEEKKSGIYIFMAGGHEGHLTLDNGKHVNNKETINLNEDDLKRVVIKGMIKAGKDNDKSKNRLVLAEKPAKPE